MKTPQDLANEFTSEQARLNGTPMEKALERAAHNLAVNNKKQRKASRKMFRKSVANPEWRNAGETYFGMQINNLSYARKLQGE